MKQSYNRYIFEAASGAEKMHYLSESFFDCRNFCHFFSSLGYKILVKLYKVPFRVVVFKL
jgi:hypothetical protein